MHCYTDTHCQAHPTPFTEQTARDPRYYRWFLLMIPLITLRTGATAEIQETLLPTLGSSLHSLPPARMSEQQLALLLQQSSQILAAAQPQTQAAAVAVSKTQSLASQLGERWLSQFGHARMSLGSDPQGKQFRGELALLLPLDEARYRPLTFSQLGVHYADNQPIANIGIGQHYLVKEWLLGYNVFLDHQLKHAHTRLGIGTELWRDYLKFSGNGYLALSSWKASKSVEWYQEKPANGFDLQAQAYWPNYPHFGAHWLFEHYFGEAVALFGQRNEQWQKNPSAMTLGIHYTLIPLITIGADYQLGQHNKKQTRLSLQLDYTFYTPWAQQIDPYKVTAQRTLARSRYDWVQRNNRLVLQYRQLAPITLTLPPQLNGYPEEGVVFDATVNTRFGLQQINWDSSILISAGGRLEPLGGTRYQVILPKTPGRYRLTGTAVDQQGNQSATATTELTVKQPIALTLPLRLSGRPGDDLDLPVQLFSKFGFKEVIWDAKAFEKAGGTLTAKPGEEDQLWHLKLPNSEGAYALTGTAYDQKGYASPPVRVEVIVSRTGSPAPITLTFTTQKLEEYSDGKPTITATVATGFERIEWDLKAFGGAAAPAEASSNPPTERSYTVTLPNKPGQYTLIGTAVDKQDQRSAPVSIQVVVLPELKITVPPLPDIWAAGESLQLQATGGDSSYHWKSNHPDISVDSQGKLTILGTNAAKITVTSAKKDHPYDMPARSFLKAMDQQKYTYDDAVKLCTSNQAAVVTKDDLHRLNKNKTWTEIKEWAELIFKSGQSDPQIWIYDDNPKNGLSTLSLKDGTVHDKEPDTTKHYVICRFKS